MRDPHLAHGVRDVYPDERCVYLGEDAYSLSCSLYQRASVVIVDIVDDHYTSRASRRESVSPVLATPFHYAMLPLCRRPELLINWVGRKQRARSAAAT